MVADDTRAELDEGEGRGEAGPMSGSDSGSDPGSDPGSDSGSDSGSGRGSGEEDSEEEDNGSDGTGSDGRLQGAEAASAGLQLPVGQQRRPGHAAGRQGGSASGATGGPAPAAPRAATPHQALAEQVLSHATQPRRLEDLGWDSFFGTDGMPSAGMPFGVLEPGARIPLPLSQTTPQMEIREYERSLGLPAEMQRSPSPRRAPTPAAPPSIPSPGRRRRQQQLSPEGGGAQQSPPRSRPPAGQRLSLGEVEDGRPFTAELRQKLRPKSREAAAAACATEAAPPPPQAHADGRRPRTTPLVLGQSEANGLFELSVAADRTGTAGRQAGRAAGQPEPSRRATISRLWRPSKVIPPAHSGSDPGDGRRLPGATGCGRRGLSRSHHRRARVGPPRLSTSGHGSISGWGSSAMTGTRAGTYQSNPLRPLTAPEPTLGRPEPPQSPPAAAAATAPPEQQQELKPVGLPADAPALRPLSAAAFRHFVLADRRMRGALQKPEVTALVRALGFGPAQVSDTFLEGCWAVFDVNGDGVFDWEEVRDLIRALRLEHNPGAVLQTPPPPPPQRRATLPAETALAVVAGLSGLQAGRRNRPPPGGAGRTAAVLHLRLPPAAAAGAAARPKGSAQAHTVEARRQLLGLRELQAQAVAGAAEASQQELRHRSGHRGGNMGRWGLAPSAPVAALEVRGRTKAQTLPTRQQPDGSSDGSDGSFAWQRPPSPLRARRYEYCPRPMHAGQ
eukprot:SAG22_NODE_85_length_21510_cov_6.472187_13_plen_731_part_00